MPHLADEHGKGDAFPDKRGDRCEFKSLVLSARDQDQRPLHGADRLLHGVEIGCLGIIDPTHPSAFGNEFAPVGRRGVVADRGGHTPGIRSQGDSRAECRHQVGHIVRPSEPRCLEIEQELPAMHDHPPFFQGDVGVWIGGAEADPLRLDPGPFLSCEHDGPILLRLVHEDPHLRLAVFLHRGITVEVVGTEVEPECDPGAEGPDRLQLEGTDLRHEDIQFPLLQKQLRHRRADIAAGGGPQSRPPKHARRQLRGGRLAVGTRDRDDRHRCQREGQFQLPDERGSLGGSVGDERYALLDSRTQDGQVMADGVMLRPGARDDGDPLLAELGGAFLQEFRISAVERCHLRPATPQQARRCHAAASQAEDHGPAAGVGIGFGDHGAVENQRSLSVAMPSKPKTIAMIQKRTVTVFSFQPESSKW